MKGRISIKDFIHRVKAELVEAQDRTDKPFYELTDVELEIGFALEAQGSAGFQLYVIEFGGGAKAQQTHKVTLKFKPIQTPAAPPASPPAGGGGGGGGVPGLRGHGPLYDKLRDPI